MVAPLESVTSLREIIDPPLVKFSLLGLSHCARLEPATGARNGTVVVFDSD